MILSDKTLKSLIQSGELSVSPLDEHSIQPASIDCRLGDHFLLVDDTLNQDITLDTPVRYTETKSQSIIIPPHRFLLATTLETIRLPSNLSAFVEGRSSIGRIGLFIQNAGWVDAGFEGKITLELYNANSLPIRLDVGRRICQLVFCRMDQHAETPYVGKYQGQHQAVGSRIFLDPDRS
ncbi:dCTP deaminase [bacterium]|nr:dCTP deaminase [bacterium]